VSADWWLHRKTFPDGRIGFVIPLTFGRGRITVGHDDLFIEDNW